MSGTANQEAASDVPAWHGEHEPVQDAVGMPHKKYRVFVYHHTHWDREWWATMQDFRIRLVELIDELLDTLENDPDFRCFLLDGQTVVLKDYLEIRPEMQDRLLHFIRKNRIQCGPWYILPDEFLVSGEAHIRNLWLGERVARRLGYDNLKVGYIPDTFGHISQMPQLLQGFEIDNAMVWRGLGGPAGSFRSEFLWEAPDGTQVFTYWFPDGYYVVDFLHFDNPLKTYDETYGRVRRSLERWKLRTSTDCLLMPYGGDHRLIDKRLPRLLKQVNRDLEGSAELQWATTAEFIDAVREQAPKLEIIRGELRQTGADAPHLLPGVLSARMYLKQLNFRGQNALERYAEPFSALAWRTAGRRYESSLLWTAWEQLVQNHPHDSICGCSIDQVHREMLPRFDQSHQIARALIEKSVQALNAAIDTSSLDEGDTALVARNPLPWGRTGAVDVWIGRHLFEPHPRTHVLTDENGMEVLFQVRPVEGMQPGTDKTRYYEVTFTALDVPGFGYRTYRLAKREMRQDPKLVYFTALQPTAKLKGSTAEAELSLGNASMENRFLRIDVNLQNGTLTVTDKRTGEVYEGLNALEDGGDAGDTYNYSAPLGNAVLRTNEHCHAVHVSIVEAGHARATMRVDVDWELPERLTEDRLSRAATRIPHRMTSYITLTAGTARIDVRTEWDNRSEDHRIRALFPLGCNVSASYAEGHFDVIERPVQVPEEGDGWPEPFVRELPQQGYVSVNNGRRGLMIANKGLPEYEVPDDGTGTIAVTLVRSVGWLSREDLLSRVGGAGPDTIQPDAQCPGRCTAEYSIIPHSGTWLDSEAYRDAHEYMTPMHGSATDKHEGSSAWVGEGIRVEGNHSLLLSACKQSEDGEALILRFWNVAKEATRAVIYVPSFPAAERPSSIQYVNLKEQFLSNAELLEDGGIALHAGPAQIVTLRIC
ncbi:alpha-mannosidase [Paenibacillus gansuensis]|uniref:Alpha-mannosidase n=1 Tax=Paenibacillus gansuensis TaxID=306542 RepID=A0ABW5P9F3_9BACL